MGYGLHFCRRDRSYLSRSYFIWQRRGSRGCPRALLRGSSAEAKCLSAGLSLRLFAPQMAGGGLCGVGTCTSDAKSPELPCLLNSEFFQLLHWSKIHSLRWICSFATQAGYRSEERRVGK